MITSRDILNLKWYINNIFLLLLHELKHKKYKKKIRKKNHTLTKRNIF